MFHLLLTFFGLTTEYRKIFKQEIFDLCYHGKCFGSYWDIYHMPIMDRRYNLKVLSDTIKASQPKDDNNLSMQDMVSSRKNILKQPDYIGKMPR